MLPKFWTVCISPVLLLTVILPSVFTSHLALVLSCELIQLSKLSPLKSTMASLGTSLNGTLGLTTGGTGSYNSVSSGFVGSVRYILFCFLFLSFTWVSVA